MIRLSEHTYSAFRDNYSKLLQKMEAIGSKAKNDLDRFKKGKMDDSKFQIAISEYEEQLDILSREAINVRCEFWEYKWEQDRERNMDTKEASDVDKA